MKHQDIVFGLLASCLLAFAPGLLAADQDVQQSSALSDHPAIASTCTECHETESTIHANHSDCTTCHKDAQPHAAADNPKSLLAGQPQSSECLACHKNDSEHMNFAFSDHNRAGVTCADCHGVHSPKVDNNNPKLTRADESSKLCATCHQDVLARFDMPSHHPVQEGGVSCVGCHDQHSSKKVSLVNNTEQCLTCHQRLRGPFAFEHAPAVEDCATCHDPHGTPTRRLLIAAQPMLCLQCHSLPNNRHGQSASNATTPEALGQPVSGALLRGCIACHSQVHGSTQDQHLRF